MISLGMGFPVASIVTAFLMSNIAGQVIVVLLFVFSIFAWSLLATKGMELAASARASARFHSVYRKEAHPLALFLKHQKGDPNPMSAIYEAGCSALSTVVAGSGGATGDLFTGAMGTEGARKIDDIQMNAVRGAVDKATSDQVSMMERHMGFVAITTTSAPLLGLLGTVWGAMDAFEKAITGGSAMLAQVAPGISGALLTTVIGLLVAIPSGIGYNILTDRIRRICVDMDSFAQELITGIETHYLRRH